MCTFGYGTSGASEYNLLQRIVETLGLPPDHMIATATGGQKYFTRVMPGSMTDATGASCSYRMLTQEEFELHENCKVSTGKRYGPLVST